MVMLGLDQSKIEAILLAGIEDDQARIAIAEAISSNNEVITKQVFTLVLFLYQESGQ